MKNLSASKLYALAFGLFLGLCIWKFGNPVILDRIIPSPVTPAQFLSEPWPTHWAKWCLLPLAAVGGLLVGGGAKKIWPSRWLWLLPLVWLGWQILSATQSVDARLTVATLWQFAGCVACYFVGAFILSQAGLWRWLLPGVLAAFVFCLVRSVEQHVYEFPQNHQMLMEGEHCGWTNFLPEAVAAMKSERIIITTNGVDVANPVILDKFASGRVSGTLVYPNALAGIVLLLWPLSLVLAFEWFQGMKPIVRFPAMGLLVFLGSAGFYWSGSKLGWLIGIGLLGLFLLRFNWSKKLKCCSVMLVLVFGLGVFGLRFHHYFAAGATSASARIDYWRAAVQTTVANPMFGSGPGTFQRSYARIKAPDAEMARLTHNDYLEQFSDSGVVGGLTYAGWILAALTTVRKKNWRTDEKLAVAILLGLLGWFAQGLGEFGLYIPALSWMAFTLLGGLVGQNINQIDKITRNR